MTMWLSHILNFSKDMFGETRVKILARGKEKYTQYSVDKTGVLGQSWSARSVGI